MKKWLLSYPEQTYEKGSLHLFDETNLTKISGDPAVIKDIQNLDLYQYMTITIPIDVGQSYERIMSGEKFEVYGIIIRVDDDIELHKNRGEDVEDIKALLEDNLARLNNQTGNRAVTGFKDLDDIASNFFTEKGLIVIGGRPMTGQTYLAFNIISSMAWHGVSVGLISMNMPAQRVIEVLLAAEAGMDKMKLINKEKLSNDESMRLKGASDILSHCQLQICDKQMTTDDIKVKAQQWVKECGMQVLCIGHSQNFIVDAAEQEKTAAILKALSNELDITIILITSQIDKKAEMRQDKRPFLREITFDGLENTADLVLLLYRDEMYNGMTCEPGVAEVQILSGSSLSATIKLSYIKEFGLFKDLYRG